MTLLTAGMGWINMDELTITLTRALELMREKSRDEVYKTLQDIYLHNPGARNGSRVLEKAVLKDHALKIYYFDKVVDLVKTATEDLKVTD